MDWMGGKLAQLIADGQKALGREVVVMSEAPEDEVDDATGDWQEDEDAAAMDTSNASISSRHGSLRRRNPHSGSTSPRKNRFAGVQIPQGSRDKSVDSVSTSANASLRENETDWQSSEMREFMERARAARAARR
jgi:hypothetical protein